ncbi:hypothetical protein D3C71_1487340 [compost metagenome]
MYSKAIAHNSLAHGLSAIAYDYTGVAIGQYNKTSTGTPTTYSASNNALVIGNGTSTSVLGNAFRVTFEGQAYGAAAYNSTGADYAEFFEWADGNPNSEDRVGRFVSLNGDKIRLTTSTDDYIVGVVSANPSVIGDSYNDDWNNKFIVDEWGRTQYHEVTVPAEYYVIHQPAEYKTDNNGEVVLVKEAYDKRVEVAPERIEVQPMYNPEWNPSMEYIGREKRKEWSAIGMVGKLLVRDDGTCEIDSYCKSNDDGIATISESGYRVMKRISRNIIQILIK